MIFNNRTQWSEKSQCSRIVYASQKSRNFQQSYTLLGESEKNQNEGFSMNVIVSASKLSKAEHQSPSAIQMNCLLIGAEVSFRMAHSQSALGAFRSTLPIQDALFGSLGSLRCTDGWWNRSKCICSEIRVDLLHCVAMSRICVWTTPESLSLSPPSFLSYPPTPSSFRNLLMVSIGCLI